jgi:hypothetical protein
MTLYKACAKAFTAFSKVSAAGAEPTVLVEPATVVGTALASAPAVSVVDTTLTADAVDEADTAG